MSPKPVLIATTNPGKLREILPMLEGLDLTVMTLADLPAIEPPEETGKTFAENARLKARYYAAASGLPTVAEDSGLVIDALDGAPGVESARFGGPDTTYPEKFALIYEGLRGRGVATSAARFVCAIALVEPDQRPLTPDPRPLTGDPPDVTFEALGIVAGEIAAQPSGEGGFGYDPIFFYPPFGCTLAEAGKRKSSVSHRGEAFRALRGYWGPSRPA